MKTEHHNGTSKVGKKGSPNQPGGPAVSPTAHCAVKSNFVKFNFNFAKLESNNIQCTMYHIQELHYV